MHHLDERKAHKHPQPIVLQLTSSTGCMLTLIALSPLLTEIHDFDTEITASGYLSTCKPRDSIEGLLICGATTVSKRPNETLVLSLHLKCPLNVSSACVARPAMRAGSTTGMGVFPTARPRAKGFGGQRVQRVEQGIPKSVGRLAGRQIAGLLACEAYLRNNCSSRAPSASNS
jgi:hypothetical protein